MFHHGILVFEGMVVYLNSEIFAPFDLILRYKMSERCGKVALYMVLSS